MSEQIDKILPRSEWQKVEVNENHEPLVDLEETEKLVLGAGFTEYKINEYKVRRTVADMLYKVAESLPNGYKLSVGEGVRSLEKQQEHWDTKYVEFKKNNPDWTEEKLEHEIGLVVARPAPLANHNCGGAVDVTLIHENEEMVNMGTNPQAMLGRDKVEMFSKFITPEQVKNRKILRDAMVAGGFVWYPGEWRHYCYGDRMWALYLSKVDCFYGPIQNIQH